MAFVVDDFGAWLVAFLADKGRSRLTTALLGTAQERALRSAADAAIRATARELRPADSEQAEQLALVITEVFSRPILDEPLAGHQTMLEGLSAGISAQLAVLGDVGLTETGQSSAELLGVSAEVIAEKLTGHLLREIVTRGSHDGPLSPLAAQLNDDVTRLQGQRLEALIVRLAESVREALARRDAADVMPPIPRAELSAESFPAQITAVTVPLSDGLLAGTMLAVQVRADRELPVTVAIMTDIVTPLGASAIPPPARLYWHPGRLGSITIAQGATGLINVARVGPRPPGAALMDTPDIELPWSLMNGRWQVELQVTANGFPALRLTGTFDVNSGDRILTQQIEWLTVTSTDASG